MQATIHHNTLKSEFHATLCLDLPRRRENGLRAFFRTIFVLMSSVYSLAHFDSMRTTREPSLIVLQADVTFEVACHVEIHSRPRWFKLSSPWIKRSFSGQRKALASLFNVILECFLIRSQSNPNFQHTTPRIKTKRKIQFKFSFLLIQ